ncbi:MinD/ParA family ATP-binding protein [Streptomyces barringtoniae]|uniref:MinD/ParA family ATP-binding protein n=1 Tax=Streptomyces barringtoniae TaxID=2892029 RepID=UPI001E4F4C53|nr:type VII secretion protein [Streptomyces barringtoniae]MCC5479528.1 type VII secretion protein [Streptomyces barringtoniae]
MTTSGRWQDDVLRELTAGSADEARAKPAPADARQPLPVRRPDQERPNPGRPSREHHTTGPVSREDEERSAPQTPAQVSPRPATEVPPAPSAPAHPGTGSPPPGVEAVPQTPTTPPNASPAVRPPRQARLPMATPEPVPTLDPRLAIALGSPQHGDSLVRRSGRSLRKLTSSAAQEVAVESRLGSMVQQPVTTGRVIAVTSIRGGVGKTTTAALLSRAFSHYRHDPVLALEADAALGTLPVRMGAQSVRWSCVELSRILTPSMQLTDITGYLVPVADGGWLLPASQGRVGAPLDVATYRTVTLALRRYFAVTVVDCETLPGEVARTAMDTAHARVVVAPLTAEGVGGTRIVLDWLGGLPHAALASTVVALTSNTPDANLDLKAATAHLRETGVTLVHLPYDRHLAGGGPIMPDRLGEATRRAATQLAAESLQRAVRVR